MKGGLPAGLSAADVAFAGVVGQRRLLRDRVLDAAALLEVHLDRIARYDGQLHAFRTVFADQARAQAAALSADDDRPLTGIPLAVKDNVAVAGHASRYGTGSAEPVATHDAELVRRLRAAGAIVVGTTTLPELAVVPFTETPATGDTRNPWDLTRTPGGSSGGSAAAVAAGLVAAAHGTDGAGSIRIPAACCGLVGLKPQRDRVPLAPHLEHWYGLSVAGFVTRTVADTALLLDVVADHDAGDLPYPYADVVATDPPPLRVALSTRAPTPNRLHPAWRAAVEVTGDRLRGLGHEVVHADPAFGEVASAQVPRYLRGIRDDLVGLVDPWATQRRTRAIARLGAWVPDRMVVAARRRGEAVAERLAEPPGGADVLVQPALAGPPPRIGQWSGRGALATLLAAAAFTPYTPVWNVTGQPALTLPTGDSHDGLPLAVQLVGRPSSEALLLALAAQLERATRFSAQRPPL